MIRLLTLVSLLALAPARAAAPPSGAEIGLGRYVAVLFAAQDYPGDDLDLKTPDRDADEIGRVLKERYGFEVEVVKDATRARILDTLAALAGQVGERDAVVVYFAGHGKYDEAGKMGYWLGEDATASSGAIWRQSRCLADTGSVGGRLSPRARPASSRRSAPRASRRRGCRCRWWPGAGPARAR